MVLILFWKIVGLIALLIGLLHLWKLLLILVITILWLVFRRDYFVKNKRKIFWYGFYNLFHAYIGLWCGYEFYKNPEREAQLGWIGVVVMFVLLYIIYKSGYDLFPLPKDLEKS